mgnify:CR=1 FL=1
MAVDTFHTERFNLGIGAHDVPDRAYATDSHSTEIRLLEVGPVGRRAFANSRLQVQWSRNQSHSAVEAPTTRVNDAFTSGGAQIAGGRRAVDFEVASDIDYVRGIHSFRGGAVFEGGQYRSDDATNYLGTVRLQQPGGVHRRPARQLYTAHRQPADRLLLPAIRRVRPGRHPRAQRLDAQSRRTHETQAHIHDLGNLGPRFGVSWSPYEVGPHDPARQHRHLLQLGESQTPTSRRCASTASASRS